ncbi:hypothetical protein, partial [Escherichia coli]|uniref:hypothetical protein n=1 Tax=Escherichia coli TaxID=562 RepID=UPI0012FF889B
MAENGYGLAGQGMGKVKSINQYRLTPGFGGFTPVWSAFVLATVVALVICLITFFVVSWILGRQGKQQSENEVTGGR